MKGNFEGLLKVILHHEGGFVNHPKDPGGMTNLGVTKRVYDEWVGRESTEEEMRNLTKEDVAPIYRKNYWDRCKCDELPDGVDLMVFDFAVNAGTGRSAKHLQEIIGTTVDGGIGPNTLKKMNEWIDEQEDGVYELIDALSKKRQAYYESLSTFETFGNGWTRRVEETTRAANQMVEED
jgi:lysozyme family protein